MSAVRLDSGEGGGERLSRGKRSRRAKGIYLGFIMFKSSERDLRSKACTAKGSANRAKTRSTAYARGRKTFQIFRRIWRAMYCQRRMLVAMESSCGTLCSAWKQLDGVGIMMSIGFDEAPCGTGALSLGRLRIVLGALVTVK